MQNLHDDNHLDNLSRKAAEQFETDQDLHSWQILEPRLDAAMPQKKERKRRFLFILFFFLLVGGGFVLSEVVGNREEASNIEQSDKAQDKATDKSTTPVEQATNDRHTTPQASNNAVENKNTNSVDVNKTNNSGDKVADNAGTTQPATQPATTGTNNASPVNKSSSVKGTAKPGGTAKITTGIAGISNSRTTTKNVLPGQQKAKPGLAAGTPLTVDKSVATVSTTEVVGGPLPQLVSLAGKPQINMQSPPRLYPGFDVTLSDPAPPAKKRSTPLNRWEFGVTYAPDISTVKFTHTQPPGNNFGVTIGYNINDRLSLQTAFIYTTKKYKMNGSDYHPPKGYWTTYVNVETVTGECSMWDIPLNIRYNVAPRKKSNFFVSTGLSSYLMQKEDYDFFYYYNGNPYNRYRSMDSASRHFMSILNISVGYERQLGKKMSWQVEPFFKQPLAGVGFGDMMLNSTGVYFTLKYKPVFRR